MIMKDDITILVTPAENRRRQEQTDIYKREIYTCPCCGEKKEFSLRQFIEDALDHKKFVKQGVEKVCRITSGGLFFHRDAFRMKCHTCGAEWKKKCTGGL